MFLFRDENISLENASSFPAIIPMIARVAPFPMKALCKFEMRFALILHGLDRVHGLL